MRTRHLTFTLGALVCLTVLRGPIPALQVELEPRLESMLLWAPSRASPGLNHLEWDLHGSVRLSYFHYFPPPTYTFSQYIRLNTMADPYQTRLPEQLASEVDELVDKHGLTTAEAMRQLVRRGVEDRQQQSNHGGGSDSPQQTGQFVGWALLSASIATFALGSATPAGAIAAAAAIVFLATAVDQYRGDGDGD